MNPDFLAPLSRFDWLCCDFVERIDSVPGSLDRESTLEELTPHHRRHIEQLGFTWDKFRRAEQVHDRRIALVQSDGDATPHPQADALISGVSGLCLGIYVADCAAIYLADPVKRAIGLAHSGKRGTELNILPETIEAMRAAFQSKPQDLVVVVSPCIRPPHYDVDFAKHIRKQAMQHGIPVDQFHDAEICTSSHLDRYYSYRTEKGATGRMLAILGIPTKSRP